MTDKHPVTPFTTLDLYCGLGGLSLGFEHSGRFHTVAGLDNFAPALDTFYRNHPSAIAAFRGPTDLAEISVESIHRRLGMDPDVIIGGPPCQGFSVAGRRLENLHEDPRNQHVWKYQEIVLGLRPKAFVMENVGGLLVTAQRERGQFIGDVIDEYEASGYTVKWCVLNSVDFGVPQKRKRVFIVGIRRGSGEFSFPEPSHGTDGSLFSRGRPYVTVADALSDLPSPTTDNPQCYELPPTTEFQAMMRHGSDVLYNHIPSVHKPEMVDRLAAQKNGTRLYPKWNHSWYRLDPGQPSPAVKENHRAPFVHFSEPRVTTPRECARLQSYPDRMVLSGTKSQTLTQLGNAVPMLLADAVAQSLGNCLALEPDLSFA